jgi:hypothetical protein
MYTVESSLYKNVNHFLRCFPIKIVGKVLTELKGILHYIYLLQSSLNYRSYYHPLSDDLFVYRGFASGGRLAPLYESMIDSPLWDDPLQHFGVEGICDERPNLIEN